MKPDTLPKLELLQALRAIAAVAVVFFHTGYQPGFGASGVSIFFVLSGVIMAMLIDGGESPMQFGYRRFIRVAPLYWLTTSFMAGLLLWSSGGSTPSLGEYLMSVFFVPFMQPNGNIMPVLGPGWTINYEMAFYITCVAGIFISQRHAILATAILVVCWWSLSCMSSTTAGLFYQKPLVFLFVCGMGLWVLFRLIRLRLSSFLALVAGLFSVAFLFYLEYISHHGSSNRFIPITKVILTILIVGLGLFSEPAYKRLNVSIRKIFLKIGDASYAIYLTHLFVIYLLWAIGAKLGISRGSLLLALLSTGLAILVGDLVFRFIDTPLHKRLKQVFLKK